MGAKKFSDSAIEYGVGAVGGAFIALFYSIFVTFLIELLAETSGFKLGLLDGVFNSPFAIGFISCLGAYHVGKTKGRDEAWSSIVLERLERKSAEGGQQPPRSDS